MDNKKRKVLTVDDNKTNLILLQANLEHMGLEVLQAEDGKTAIETAITEQPDLILLDVMMPEMDGFEACRKLKDDSRTFPIPVIFISAKSESCDKIKGLQLGAVDYITKPFDAGELKARVSTTLQIVELQEKLLALANTDGLTGLTNRRHFFDILEREIFAAKIKGDPLAVLMFDIDHFKSINDTYGHHSGDVVLKEIAEILHENIYPLDVAARYGGEEFVVLMPQTSAEKATAAAERFRGIIDQHRWQVLNDRISVTTSIGLAVIDWHSLADSWGLVEKADAALYAAKRRGRNCVVRWDQVRPEEAAAEPENKDYHEMQVKVSSLAIQLRSHALGTISALAEAADMVIKDPYTAHHGENVRLYAVAIAEEMGLSVELKERLGTAALLQDLGKISIPESILKKTTPLTEQERQIIRQHPAAATKILEPIGIFNLELQIIKHHHENFDGTGYPDGLKGREIPIGARILRVADSFDAITSDRVYRPAKLREDALQEIAGYSGTQFDPDVVEAFQKAGKKHMAQWPLSNPNSLAKSTTKTRSM